MKRTHVADFQGESVKLGVTMGALEALCEAGFDPMLVAEAAVSEAAAHEAGKEYTPEYVFNSLSVAEILTIGNDHGEKHEGLPELLMQNGFLANRTQAFEYLAAFCNSHSEEPTAKKGGKAGK